MHMIELRNKHYSVNS